MPNSGAKTLIVNTVHSGMESHHITSFLWLNTFIPRFSRRWPSKTPPTREKRIQRIIDRRSSPVLVFFCVRQKRYDGSSLFLSYVSLSFMQHARASSLTILVRLFIEWIEWFIFTLGRTRVVAKPRYTNPRKTRYMCTSKCCEFKIQ
jgi:hypothetical protein